MPRGWFIAAQAQAKKKLCKKKKKTPHKKKCELSFACF
jgi:hypothetical protein